jgi:hypothetical protein
MQRRRRPLPTVQPELFRPRPERPCWRTLPAEVRQQVLVELARLLRNHHVRSARRVNRVEVHDE